MVDGLFRMYRFSTRLDSSNHTFFYVYFLSNIQTPTNTSAATWG